MGGFSENCTIWPTNGWVLSMVIPGSSNGGTVPYFVGHILGVYPLKNRPYIWDWYLQFGFLKWPMILCLSQTRISIHIPKTGSMILNADLGDLGTAKNQPHDWPCLVKHEGNPKMESMTRYDPRKQLLTTINMAFENTGVTMEHRYSQWLCGKRKSRQSASFTEMGGY